MAAEPEATAPQSSYLELRVYETKPDQRDRFLAHFEEHYLESQEAEGMRIWGQFRDVETEHNFVWMRGYAVLAERPASLMRFYTSALWYETSPKVGEMLAMKAKHVHFLGPITDADAFDDGLDRRDEAHDRGLVVVHLFATTSDAAPRIGWLREKLTPALEENGARTLGLFRSSDEENNFPMLPYIEDEPALVWIGSYPDRESYDSSRDAFPAGAGPFETFVLEPGQRSRLFHR